MPPALTIEQIQNDILAYVERDENDCWNWTKYLAKGYAQLTRPKLGHTACGTRRVSRIMYMLTHGVWLDGHDMTMVIDHICRNKACINPAHLQYISNGDNLRRTASHDLSHVSYHRPERHNLKEEDIFYYRNNGRPSSYKRCRPCFNRYMNDRKKASKNMKERIAQ